METEKPANWGSFLQNSKQIALKQFMVRLLEQKYPAYDDLFDRISFFLVTDGDMKAFSKMIGDVYEVGYFKAMEDYKEQLNKLGIKVNLNQRNLADNQK